MNSFFDMLRVLVKSTYKHCSLGGHGFCVQFSSIRGVHSFLGWRQDSNYPQFTGTNVSKTRHFHEFSDIYAYVYHMSTDPCWLLKTLVFVLSIFCLFIFAFFKRLLFFRLVHFWEFYPYHAACMGTSAATPEWSISLIHLMRIRTSGLHLVSKTTTSHLQ